ncbi:GGDEF domain-containing protein (plasmid) [Tistrella mobilis]|uniref:GGDEF domain-containing protein n=1 Tax=Tistrella mobilis TaxID=171437 RepID=UPI0035573FC2
MPLDPDTLLASSMFINASGAIVFSLFWLADRRAPELALWAAGYVLVSLGLLGMMLLPTTEYPSAWAGGAVFLLCGISPACFWLGTRYFDGIRPVWRGPALIVGAIPGLHHVAATELGHPPATVAATSALLLAVLYAVNTHVLARGLGRDAGLSGRWPVARSVMTLCIGLYGLSFLASALVIWQGGGSAMTAVIVIVSVIDNLLGVISCIALAGMLWERARADLAREARIDPLTGLFNRRGLHEGARPWLARTRPLVVIIADIDRFKRINDAHGHAGGDTVLTTFAHLIRDVCPAEDSLLARIGGEEFVILLRHADPDAARHFAERLRRAVETGSFLVGGERLAITVSIGLAFPAADDTDLTPALERADRALYAAKRGGRNRVEELAAV